MDKCHRNIKKQRCEACMLYFIQNAEGKTVRRRDKTKCNDFCYLVVTVPHRELAKDWSHHALLILNRFHVS